MSKRKKCRAKTVMVGRNRCAKVSCGGRILKGRVKCRRKVAGKARHAKVYTKSRKHCKFGKRKGTKICRKHPKRTVHRKSVKRATPRKQKRTVGRKTHRHNPRYSGLKAYEGGRPLYNY